MAITTRKTSAAGVVNKDAPLTNEEMDQNFIELVQGKSDVGHDHEIADVNGLQSALDGKAASSHPHTIANVTGLQAALDGKAAASHGHDWGDISGKPTTATRWPSWSEVSSKPTSFTPASHTHPVSQITGLGTAATKDVGTDDGNVMEVGAFGIGKVLNYNPDITLEAQHIDGLGSASHGNRVPIDGPDPYIGKVLYIGNATWGTQLWFSYNEGKAWFRNKETGKPYEPWKEFIHTGNIRTSLGYSIYPVSQKLVTEQLAAKANSSHTHPWAQVTGQPATATRWPTWSEVTSKPSLVETSRTISAGNGLSGGGSLASNRTISLGTPSTITGSSTNSVASSSHTHAISLNASDVGAVNSVGGDWDVYDCSAGDHSTGTDHVLILCPVSGNHNVIGSLWMERSSGHYSASKVDIIYSTSNDGTNRSAQLSVLQNGYREGTYSLVEITVGGTDFVALRRTGSQYFLTKAFFSGHTTYKGVNARTWYATGDVTLKSTIGLTGGYVVYGGSIEGNGSGLTNLNASRLTSGTIPTSRLPASALIGDTTYSAGIGLSLSGTTFSVTNPFNPSGTYSGLRAQGTTKADVGLGNVPNWSGSTSTSLGTSNTVIPSQGAVKSYVDSGLSGKANSSHNHSWSNITSGVPATATRWPTWSEVTSKPSTFTPSSHNHSGANITSGTIPTARGVLGTSTASGLMRHNGSSQTNGAFYSGTTNPNTTGQRMNYQGALYVGLLWSSSNVTAYSDARVKTDLRRIDKALDKVCAINGYTYKRTDIDCPRKAGVIAQEVLEVLPEVVTQDKEGNKHYSVEYGSMVALLIEAIKEQQKQIDALKPWYKKLYEWVKEKF